MVWSEKNYSEIENSLKYFYNTYVKNLRYYFYLAQDKINKNSLVKRDIILKVPKEYLELEKIDEKMFRQYILNYNPEKLTEEVILAEINEVCGDIFFFLLSVEKDFCFGQFMRTRMKN